MTGNKNFGDRLRLVQWLEIRTISEGRKEGLGPADKPYSMRCGAELLARRERGGRGTILTKPNERVQIVLLSATGYAIWRSTAIISSG